MLFAEYWYYKYYKKEQEEKAKKKESVSRFPLLLNTQIKITQEAEAEPKSEDEDRFGKTNFAGEYS